MSQGDLERATEKAHETELKEDELQNSVEAASGKDESVPKSVVEEKKRFEANKEDLKAD
ncbi:MAG: hypothetical protein ACYCQJ_01555 [Nitrososphaerales archaeon]